MNKLLIKVLIVATIGAIILSVVARPLLIRYYINRYESAKNVMGHSGDITEIKSSIQSTTDCLRELERLGHIESYSIPIHKPHADAEKRVEMITSYSMSQNVLTILLFQSYATHTELSVIDKAGNRKCWEFFVSEYLEAK